MSRRTRRPRRPAPVPTIVPAGEPGAFRVCYPSGEYSETMTLSEAREIVRLDELNSKRRGHM